MEPFLWQVAKQGDATTYGFNILLQGASCVLDNLMICGCRVKWEELESFLWQAAKQGEAAGPERDPQSGEGVGVADAGRQP